MFKAQRIAPVSMVPTAVGGPRDRLDLRKRYYYCSARVVSARLLASVLRPLAANQGTRRAGPRRRVPHGSFTQVQFTKAYYDDPDPSSLDDEYATNPPNLGFFSTTGGGASANRRFSTTGI